MASFFTTSTELTTDQNNNEVTVTRRRLSLRRTLIAVLCIGSIAATIGVVSSASLSKDNDNNKLQWAPFLPKPTQEQLLKLQRIRELAPHSKDWVMNEDVCYTSECLDTAIQFLLSINTTVKPCDDFPAFACGNWYANNPRPETSPRYSQFNILRDRVNKITGEILAEPIQADDFKPLKQVKRYYDDCINAEVGGAKQENLEATYLRSADFGGWPTIGGDANKLDLSKALGTIRQKYLDSPIVRVYVSEDIKNTSQRVVHLDQGTFFVSRSVLLDQENEENKKLIDAYVEYYATVAVEFSQVFPSAVTKPVAEAQARSVIAFETKLAQVSGSDENRTNTTRIYNKYTLNDYIGKIETPAKRKILWKEHLDALFEGTGIPISDTETVIALEEEYLEKVHEIIETEEPNVVANYVHWRLISGLIPETTEAMRNAAFKWTQARTGQSLPSARTTVCANSAMSGFGMAIGTKYVERAFDTAAKENVDAMVGNLMLAFRQILNETGWMDLDTRANALAKSETIRSFMAFPEWISEKNRMEKEYEGLSLPTEPAANTYLDSVIKLSNWMGDQTLKTLRVPTDKDDYWLTYPGVVNAFYSPELNSITFPAGILQPPFYRKGALEAVNFGGIGVVIGHEITHGFDDQGSQYDKDGNAEDWWSVEVKAEFLEKAKCIIDQYSNFETEHGNVNGQLTQGENIADNGGLREAFRAYLNWVATSNNGQPEQRLPGLEEYSAEQLFFLSYANLWCEDITPEALRNQLLTDPHAPAEFRILGALQNSVIFSERWGCPAGSKMNPPSKCTVW